MNIVSLAAQKMLTPRLGSLAGSPQAGDQKDCVSEFGLDKALEVSLLPALDPLLVSATNPTLAGQPKVVTVVGTITREDDPNYRKEFTYRTEFDPSSGEGRTNGSIVPVDSSEPPTIIYEQWQSQGTSVSSIGRVAQDERTDPPNSTCMQRVTPQGGMCVEGVVGEYAVRADLKMKNGKPSDEGFILHRVNGRVDDEYYFHRTSTYSLDGEDMAFSGMFGPHEDRGVVRSSPAGAVRIERTVGPYRIEEDITREWNLAAVSFDGNGIS